MIPTSLPALVEPSDLRAGVVDHQDVVVQRRLWLLLGVDGQELG